MRWVKKFQTSQSIERKDRVNVAYKVQQKHIKFIKSTINEDKTITMEDLLKKIQIKYPHFNISRVHLGRVVKDLNITQKHFINHNKDKLIIMDNAPVHKNKAVRDLINENNNLLFSVPYQHYTNAIEGYFNVLKSRLNKKNGITYDDLVKNVKSIIKDIPKQTYYKLFIGSYQRSETYKPKKSRKKTLKKYKE